MIHHLSISANNPLHVAQVIAELWQGEALPFPFHPGSYVVFTYDPNGTLIEIYPHGTELKPNPQPSIDQSFQFTCNANASAYSATHAAISVPLSLTQIQEIGAREGWWTLHRGRHGFFELVELWIENQFLLELLPPEFATQYRDFMQPQNLKQILATIPT